MKLWPSTTAEARKIQIFLRKKLKILPLTIEPEYICGVDAAFVKSFAVACASLFKFPELISIQNSIAVAKINFPYIPTFLSFREGRAIIKAIRGLSIKPDVILFDGQGIAHPLSFGIASHIGVLLNTPSVGCAKSKLVGEYKEPAIKKGSYSFLFYNQKAVGVVLRTKDNVKPIFVSPGHLIDIESSIKIVLNSVTEYRIPEPLRKAHQIVKAFIKKLS
ncbi:MAG: endonuclease V [Thermodesulfovibrionaceae bacterium]